MWNVFVGLAVAFLLTPVASAQMYPMACAPQVKKTLLTEQNICSDDACRKSLQQTRELIRTLKSPDERAMLEDLDYLKVAMLLNSESHSAQSYENFIENQIGFLQSALRSNFHFKERYEAHKKEPARAAEMDRIRLILLKQDVQKIEKKMAEMNQAPKVLNFSDTASAIAFQDEYTKKFTMLAKEQGELKNEIHVLEEMPKYLEMGETIVSLIDKSIQDTQFQLRSFEEIAKKKKDLNFSGRDSWFFWNTYQFFKFTSAKIKNRPTFRDCALRDSELFAINYYTESGYRSLNRTLHGKPQNPSGSSWIAILNESLPKLQNYVGTVKRGGKLTPEQIQQYEKGRVISFPAFMSTSVKKGFDAEFSFTIRSLKGKYIAPLSSSPTEEEVLFLPGTRFKVIDVKGKEYFLEEMP